jgi:NAD(P)-dependent dehydrogenase (short-subunit alcohol dehydrogenase family)
MGSWSRRLAFYDPIQTIVTDTYLQYGFVCVVTGATQPVGRAITLELAGPQHSCLILSQWQLADELNSTRRSVHLRSVVSYAPAHAPSRCLSVSGQDHRRDGPLLTWTCLLSACSSSPGENYSQLADEVNKEHPNTKVIGYPYNFANEEATLGLIDDVLNSWGR